MPQQLEARVLGGWQAATCSLHLKCESAPSQIETGMEQQARLPLSLYKGHAAGIESTRICHCWWLTMITTIIILPLNALFFLFGSSPSQRLLSSRPHLSPSENLGVFLAIGFDSTLYLSFRPPSAFHLASQEIWPLAP